MGKRGLFRRNRLIPNHVAACEALEARVCLSSPAAVTNPVVPAEPGEFHFFTDASLTTPGLTGSYINQDLQGIAAQDDWRTTQTAAGTRVDSSLTFITDNWGMRSQVGITGGTDQVWQNFSVQWDGYVQIVSPHIGLTLNSDNGSRMWIDLNHDGSFAATAPEYTNDVWGTVPNFLQTASTPFLEPGVYPVRIQFGVDSGGNAFEVTAHAPPMVRVAYIVPSNRTPQDGAVPALQQAVVWMQKFYQEQMDRYGFGPLTFDYETQADGVTPQVWTIHVNDTDANIRANLFNNTINDAIAAGVPVGHPGQDWMLIPLSHLEASNGAISGSASLGLSLGSGLGGGEAITASDLLPFLTDSALTDDRPYAGMTIPGVGPFPLVQGVSYPDFNGRTISSLSSVIHGAFIHELTHGFGLPHDQINDGNAHGNLMYNGFRGFRGWAYPFRYGIDDMTLGYDEALALSTSDYFHPTRAVQDSDIPHILTIPGGTVPLAGGLLPLHFTVTDTFGLSAVVLLKNGDMIGAMPLSGTNFDGTITTPYFTKGHADTYGLVVYDQAGNRQERDATITAANGSDAAPQPFVFLSHSTVATNDVVSLNAGGSTDPDDSIVKVEWDLGDGNFVASPGTTMTATFAQPGTHLIRARLTDAHGNQSVSNPIALRVLGPAPMVSSFAVNDGSPQRSIVSSLTVTFDQPVTLPSSSIALISGATGALIPTAVSNPSGDGKTYVISFTGPSLIGSSLPDGNYTLFLNGRIESQALFAQPVDTSDASFQFTRLFGDANGDGKVGFSDLLALAQTYGSSTGNPNFLPQFDYDGDGRIDFDDLLALVQRFNQSLRVRSGARVRV